VRLARARQACNRRLKGKFRQWFTDHRAFDEFVLVLRQHVARDPGKEREQGERQP